MTLSPETFTQAVWCRRQAVRRQPDSQRLDQLIARRQQELAATERRIGELRDELSRLLADRWHLLHAADAV